MSDDVDVLVDPSAGGPIAIILKVLCSLHCCPRLRPGLERHLRAARVSGIRRLLARQIFNSCIFIWRISVSRIPVLCTTRIRRSRHLQRATRSDDGGRLWSVYVSFAGLCLACRISAGPVTRGGSCGRRLIERRFGRGGRSCQTGYIVSYAPYQKMYASRGEVQASDIEPNVHLLKH